MKCCNIDFICSYLEELFPYAHCELNYSKDYELLIAIVLSAQTTDKKVNKVTQVLFNKYDTIDRLALASLDDISDIIREIGTFRKKSVYVRDIAFRLVTECGGMVPNDREYLLTLPGVGVKTVNVFLAEYYNVPAIAVDTHINRVSKRLGLAFLGDDVLVVEDKLKKIIPRDKWIIMHHRFIFFGRYFCRAVKPNCGECKLRDICDYYNKKGT